MVFKFERKSTEKKCENMLFFCIFGKEIHEMISFFVHHG